MHEQIFDFENVCLGRDGLKVGPMDAESRLVLQSIAHILPEDALATPGYSGADAAEPVYRKSKALPPAPRLATSSCEAETVAACAAAKEAVLSRKWQQATTGVAPRTLLLGDNASSIKAETNGSDNDGSKHVDVAAHYVRERMRSGDISYHYISTTENIADCLSKNNYYPAFKKFRAAMGVA